MTTYPGVLGIIKCIINGLSEIEGGRSVGLLIISKGRLQVILSGLILYLAYLSYSMPGRCRFRRFIAITAYFAAAALLVKILPPLLLGSRSGLALVDRHDAFVSQRFASALEAMGSRFVELVTSNLLQHGLLLSVLFSRMFLPSAAAILL